MGQPVVQVDVAGLQRDPRFTGVDFAAVSKAVAAKATEIVVLNIAPLPTTSTATVTLGRAIATKYVAPFELKAGAGADQYAAKVTDLVDKRDWDAKHVPH